MLDENLNLWFIETNSSPAFHGYSEPMEKFIVKMLQDHFEIVVGLLRSRMKRVVMYVNKIIESGDATEIKGNKVLIQNFETRRDEFKEITKNHFEEDYKPRTTNGFSKIIDGNYDGVEKCQGLIQSECL